MGKTLEILLLNRKAEFPREERVINLTAALCK